MLTNENQSVMLLDHAARYLGQKQNGPMATRVNEPAPAEEKMDSQQTEILSVVKKRGLVSSGNLSRTLGVGPPRIRQDISARSEKKSLHRFHGSTGFLYSVENMACDTRQLLCQPEIARALAGDTPKKASLLLNISTTIEVITDQALTASCCPTTP